MPKFSKACEYGIRATVFVAQQSQQGQRAKLPDIARATGSPVAFTAKIFQRLTRAGVIGSTVGPGGGFEIEAVRLRQLTLSEVVDAIDGDAIYRGCGLGLPRCDESRPCPLHDRFTAVREQLREMLQTTSLRDLAADLTQGLAFLKH